MGYHIITVDSVSCSLTCKDKQFVCTTSEERHSIPLEDVAAIVVTSFSASIHASLLIEAAKIGVGFVLCDSFKPTALLLPADRCTDTHLMRSQGQMSKISTQRLWRRTISAKCSNQYSLAAAVAPHDSRLAKLQAKANGRHPDKEADTARLYWAVFSRALSGRDDFKRERGGEGLNVFLNYGYAVLLSTMLQKLFAVGIDPTFGIGHVTRAHSTPLAYDLMEPFRPLVDARISTYISEKGFPDSFEIDTEFRQWIAGFLLQTVKYEGKATTVQNVIEGVVRTFRRAITENKTTLYQPWTQQNSKWDG